jgi:hypothetical protein
MYNICTVYTTYTLTPAEMGNLNTARDSKKYSQLTFTCKSNKVINNVCQIKVMFTFPHNSQTQYTSANMTCCVPDFWDIC